jgi:hypothetical protein
MNSVRAAIHAKGQIPLKRRGASRSIATTPRHFCEQLQHTSRDRQQQRDEHGRHRPAQVPA